MRAFAAFAAACVCAVAAPWPGDAARAQTPAPVLAGPLAAYAWFPGRWACRTSKASQSSDAAPGKLWVFADSAGDAITERFAMTLPSGQTYRSDDTLRYDKTAGAFERQSIDANGVNVLLAAKQPFASTMQYYGIMALSAHRKAYRMRATVAVDRARDEFTSVTAFLQPDKKTWAPQATTACSRIGT